jgi:DNA-directed RNA polymerase subunit K/omega
MMKSYKIAVIKGDGIGPEIVDEAIKVLYAVAHKENFTLTYSEYLMGGAALDVTGVPLPDETVRGAKDADAVLFGAIGGPKWDNLERHLRPESGLLAIRKELGTYANLRPAIVYDELGVINDPLHQTIPFLTKYEKARILGERAKQINGGAKPFVDLGPEIIDGFIIASAELEQKKIPFIIRRPLMNGGCEYWKLKDLEQL